MTDATSNARPRPRPSRGAGAAVTLEPLGDLASARPLWERLEAGTENPFASWDFADAWWSRMGDGARLRLHAVRDGDDVVGLLPAFEQGGELRLIGHGDADLLGPIATPQHDDRALAGLRLLCAELGLPLLADALPEGCAARLGGRVIRRTPSPVADLPAAGFDALLALRTPSLRRNFERYSRRAQRLYDVQLRSATAASLDNDLDALFALHNDRWEGTTSVFSGPRAALHRTFAIRAFRRGWLRLRVLEFDGVPVAANHAFRVGSAEWYYQAGRDPARARDSVGVVLQAHCVRAACEEGAREYRLLRGGEAYKYGWANRDATLETVVLA